ncbi:hypothetical protein OESDEN_12460 [Oesophagostomum dentatum]|uniref:Uncharacterized protein n=1 Tax=Oesophagostomum dentatum TaxID=61180 RepID=A0A0B1SW63_OESDE|nr:hypothetical protein OESDEN_12460 [Oesophagostomum dentatum]
MERCRRLRAAVTALDPRRAVETTIRVLVASTANYYLSQSIFDQRLIPFLDSSFKASSISSWDAFRVDTQRMAKMQRLWPPHPNFELSLVFTIFLYVLLK